MIHHEMDSCAARIDNIGGGGCACGETDIQCEGSTEHWWRDTATTQSRIYSIWLMYHITCIIRSLPTYGSRDVEWWQYIRCSKDDSKSDQSLWETGPFCLPAVWQLGQNPFQLNLDYFWVPLSLWCGFLRCLNSWTHGHL